MSCLAQVVKGDSLAVSLNSDQIALKQDKDNNLPRKKSKMKRHPHQSNQNRMIPQQTPSHISRETGRERQNTLRIALK